MQAERGIEAAVLAGARSQFDVVADGVTVFSKQRLGRFPEPGEVGRLLP
ncbi:hypothetical protein Gocc_3032 [Gaiella occulta]|uniref:Uncharacterized protein n=1 Tax=Gaiella occulta TaxID=1002870 RepID=A0A7M2YUT3_9ACTN|nr:Rdx family protein [Gaiella occulta]RDI73237.1 hypothetical protein Gocc_3032 [Gaiella occulta]